MTLQGNTVTRLSLSLRSLPPIQHLAKQYNLNYFHGVFICLYCIISKMVFFALIGFRNYYHFMFITSHCIIVLPYPNIISSYTLHCYSHQEKNPVSIYAFILILYILNASKNATFTLLPYSKFNAILSFL